MQYAGCFFYTRKGGETMLYIIGIILCNTYSLPTPVLVLCWIGAVLKGISALSAFVKGIVKGITKHDD